MNKLGSKGAVAIIVSAGMGKRMPPDAKKKNFLLLNGRPVLAHTLAPFEASALITAIVIVTGAADIELCQREVVEKFGFKKIAAIVAGGKERQDSVAAGLDFIGSKLPGTGDDPVVAIHDGARCLVTTAIIDNAIMCARSGGASAVMVPVKDTIKEAVEDGKSVEQTLSRERLYSVQTPQAFGYRLIKKAMDSAQRDGFLGTDSSSLVERIGEKVLIVEGSYENIKITTEEDLHLAERLFGARENT